MPYVIVVASIGIAKHIYVEYEKTYIKFDLLT